MKWALWLQITLYNSHNTAFIALEKYYKITTSYIFYDALEWFLHKYKPGWIKILARRDLILKKYQKIPKKQSSGNWTA